MTEYETFPDCLNAKHFPKCSGRNAKADKECDCPCHWAQFREMIQTTMNLGYEEKVGYRRRQKS